MTVKSVLEVDIQDGAFQKFAADFAKYQEALKNTPRSWNDATKAMDGSKESFKELVELSKQRLTQTRAIAAAEKAAADELDAELIAKREMAELEKELAREQEKRIKEQRQESDEAEKALLKAIDDKAKARAAEEKEQAAQFAREKEAFEKFVQRTKDQKDAWGRVARDVKSFATSIKDATVDLLKWASITGLISGALGVGGLMGIDRLAIAAGGRRRSGLGLDVTPGEQQSFGVNYGRVIDPNQFLGGVNEALHDVTKRIGLYGAGLTEKDLAGKDTAGVAAELLPALKALADRTPEKLLGNILSARHLDQFITLQDFERLKNTPAGEIAGYGRSYQRDIQSLDLTSQQTRAWQDLQVTLDLAGKTIEKTLIVGLTSLAEPIAHLSQSLVHLVEALANSPRIQKFIDEVAKSFERFAKKLDKPEFLKSVTDFGDKIGEFANNVAKDLPDIETFFHVLAGLGRAAGKTVGPFVTGIPGGDDDLTRTWNRLHPDQQVPVTPSPKQPFSWWNPGSWFDHAPEAQGADQSKALVGRMDRLTTVLERLFMWSGGTGGQGISYRGSATPRPGIRNASYMQPLPGSLGAPLPGGSAIPEANPAWASLPFDDLAKKLGVPTDFAKGIFGIEGGLNADGSARVSRAGAIGAGQLMPGTAHDLGVNPYNAKQNIYGSLRYMAMLLKRFKGNEDEAAAAYNWGAERVSQAMKAHGKRWLDSAPTETQRYVGMMHDRNIGRPTLGNQYAHIYNKPPPTINLNNATGGNTTVTVSQLGVQT